MTARLSCPPVTATPEAFERLTGLLLDATGRELRIRRLAHALAETSRRVNLLERRVAPAVDGEAKGVTAALEECEREEQRRWLRLLDPSRRC